MSTDEAMASVYLDNKLVKQTDWKPVSQQCWDLKFSLDLDRVCHLLFDIQVALPLDLVFLSDLAIFVLKRGIQLI